MAQPTWLQNKTVEIGRGVDDFQLPAVNDGTYRLSDYRGQVVVVDFWSATCPISESYEPFFKELHDRYRDRDVQLLAIDSNGTYDEQEIRYVLEKREVRFPVLRDEGAMIADRFGAFTTPHAYVIDREGRLIYEGAVDDRNWEKKRPDVNYVEEAIEAVLAGEEPEVQQTDSFGCTIERNW